MTNKAIVDHLDQISNYYLVADDPARTKAFKVAARNIELLSFEITKSNINDVKFKGLGKSTIEEVRSFLDTGSSPRLVDLKQQLPPIGSLELLSLFNFDLEYIHHLWKTYGVYNLQQLSSVNEKRVLIALAALKKAPTQIIQFPNPKYRLLGDCIVQTAYGAGELSVDQIAERLVEMDDKHIFIADHFKSPNVLGGITLDRILSQRESIKKAQIAHNIRIFHGAIVDVDLDGKLIAPDILSTNLEFVVLKLSTMPHTKVISRFNKALGHAKALGFKNNIMIDCLDRYSTFAFQQGGLTALIAKHNPIVTLSSEDPIESSSIVNFLGNTRLSKVALSSYATSIEEFDLLTESTKVAAALGLQSENLINCRPMPFISVDKLTPTTEKDSSPPENSQQRIESALERIRHLQKNRDNLGGLIKKEPK